MTGKTGKAKTGKAKTGKAFAKAKTGKAFAKAIKKAVINFSKEKAAINFSKKRVKKSYITKSNYVTFYKVNVLDDEVQVYQVYIHIHKYMHTLNKYIQYIIRMAILL